MRQSVEDFMSRSNATRVRGTMSLGAGCGVAIWENRDDRVHYERPDNHTFSLYLADGTGTRRLDAGGVAGWPGAVCVMPAGHRSDWEITTPFRFVHLYLSDARLRSAFSEIHDCDARRLEVREESFAERREIARPLGDLARAAWLGETLLAEAALAELIGRLPGRAPCVRGGLPAHILDGSTTTSTPTCRARYSSARSPAWRGSPPSISTGCSASRGDARRMPGSPAIASVVRNRCCGPGRRSRKRPSTAASPARAT
jgi:hypothetical protein